MSAKNITDAQQDRVDAINKARDTEDLRYWERLDAQDPREVAAFERSLDEVFGLDGAR